MHPGQVNYHVLHSSRLIYGVPAHEVFAVKRYPSDLGKPQTPDLITNSKQWEKRGRADTNS